MTNIVSRLMPTTQPTFMAARPRDAAAIFRSASYESSEATDVGTPDQAENTRRFVTLAIPE